MEGYIIKQVGKERCQNNNLTSLFFNYSENIDFV
jgi:hypothetical protein